MRSENSIHYKTSIGGVLHEIQEIEGWENEFGGIRQTIDSVDEDERHVETNFLENGSVVVDKTRRLSDGRVWSETAINNCIVRIICPAKD